MARARDRILVPIDVSADEPDGPAQVRSVDTKGLPVVWASIEFEDTSKIRPVVVLEANPFELRVLSTTSKDKSRWPECVFIDPKSSRTYDYKAHPSWVNCSSVLTIGWESVRYPDRVGHLSPTESADIGVVVAQLS